MAGQHRVVEQNVAPRLVAGVRALVPKGQVGKQFGQYLDRVYAAGKNGSIALDGQNVFIYRGASGGILTCDFCVGAKAPFAAVGDVTPIQTPAGVAATTTNWGDYGGIRDANAAIHEWSRTTGKKFAGPSWEVYGHFDPDPAKCRVDIYYLLAE